MINATFSLHSNDPVRRVTWWIEEPKDLDLLYYTQKQITQEEKDTIEGIQLGNTRRINEILSNYI